MSAGGERTERAATATAMGAGANAAAPVPAFGSSDLESGRDVRQDITVLITGFEPFGGERINPSQQVIEALHGWRPRAGVVVATRLLPCVFGDALRALDDALARERPALVIALGQAASRDAISVERVAINVDDARIADNAGAQPVDQPVIAGGAAAYFSTLPIKAIVAALREAGLPAEVSQTAGTFVCNHVFYGLAHAVAHAPRPLRGGFIHLPCLPEQTNALQGRAGLPLNAMIDAVRIAVRVALATSADTRQPGGAID
jgi:pyroglutamyl-peptidase